MKTLIITALLISGTWAMERPTFSQFDLNNDGKITQSELDDARMQRMKQRSDEGRMLKNTGESHSFRHIDINSDGAISKQEFDTHQNIHHKQPCMTFG